MSAGRAWALKLRRLLRSQEKKTSKRQNGEGRKAQNQISAWGMDTENRGFHWGFLCPSSAEPHPVAALPWVGSSKWHFGELDGPELSRATAAAPELQAQPQSEGSGVSLSFTCPGLWEPQQAVNNTAFYSVSLSRKEIKKKKKRVHRKLLCSRDTQSWLEGWGWEAKWKSFPDKSLCWLVLWHSASQMKNQKKKNPNQNNKPKQKIKQFFSVSNSLKWDFTS